MASLKKNVASQNVPFCLVSPTTGQGVTAANTIIYLTKDGGSQATGSGTTIELGHGQYNYAPTQAETNATVVGIYATCASAVCTNTLLFTDIVDANGLTQIDVVDWQGAQVLPLAGFNGVTGLVQVDIEAVGYEEAGGGGLLTGNQVNANVTTWNGGTVNESIGGKIDAASLVIQAAVSSATSSTIRFTQNFAPPLLNTINGFYVGCVVLGQPEEAEAQVSAVIVAWNGTTLTATVSPAMSVIPGNTDFLTIVNGTVNVAGWNGASVGALPTNFSSFAIDGSGGVTVGAVEASASNIKKGQPLNNFKFVMLSLLTGRPQAGLTITATRDIDNGGFAPCANSASNVGNGWYSINLASSDMNGNVIALRFTATNATDCNIEIITQP